MRVIVYIEIRNNKLLHEKRSVKYESLQVWNHQVHGTLNSFRTRN